MSDEKRLGANPLDWVSQAPPADMDDSPFTKAPATAASLAAERAAASREPQETVFSTPDTLSEEDLMSKGKIKIKKTMDTVQAVAYLEDLANSLSAGMIRVEDGEETLVLNTAETLKFEMKLSRKKDKAKCSIEMEWVDDGSGAEGFRISGDKME